MAGRKKLLTVSHSISHSTADSQPATSLLALLRALVLQRHLLWCLVQREIAGRYRGSWGGLLWSILLPCVMLGVYLFVFGVVYSPVRARGIDTSFALSLFAGMLLHGLVAECLARAPAAVLAQPSYVKKVVFPIELLPLTVVGAAVIQFLFGSCVLFVALLGWQGLSAFALLWPVAWLPLLALCIGIAFALSALTVYLRDLAQITGFIATLLLFLSPVFYPLEQAPAAWQQWLLLNPLTIPIETTRALLVHGRWPSLVPWLIHAAICTLALWVGWWLFQRTRRGFADVI